MLGYGRESQHNLVPEYLDNPDWEFFIWTMALLQNSHGFHNEEQSVQVVCAWPYLSLVQDMGWKHTSETHLKHLEMQN